jgi:hypothetical protein
MLSALGTGPLTTSELQAVLRVNKKWPASYTVNVLITAQELELVAYDGVRWHPHEPGAEPPPKVEKPKSPPTEDDVYPDQLPL